MLKISFSQVDRSLESSRRSRTRFSIMESTSSLQGPESSRRCSSRQSLARAWPGSMSLQNCADEKDAHVRFSLPASNPDASCNGAQSCQTELKVLTCIKSKAQQALGLQYDLDDNSGWKAKSKKHKLAQNFPYNLGRTLRLSGKHLENKRMLNRMSSALSNSCWNSCSSQVQDSFIRLSDCNEWRRNSEL